VVTVESDMPYPGSRNEPQHSFHHSKSRPENRDERELLPAYAPPSTSLERRLDGRLLQGELTGSLVRHEHCDLIDELLEDLRRCSAIPKDGELVLDKRVPDDEKCRELRGGVHGAEATIFAHMKEYQAVVLRLTQRAKDDEDAITDLMNERSRGGWEPAMMTQDAQRLVIVFQRATDGEG